MSHYDLWEIAHLCFVIRICTVCLSFWTEVTNHLLDQNRLLKWDLKICRRQIYGLVMVTWKWRLWMKKKYLENEHDYVAPVLQMAAWVSYVWKMMTGVTEVFTSVSAATSSLYFIGNQYGSIKQRVYIIFKYRWTL